MSYNNSPPVIKIPIKLLFHIYTYHKDLFNSFRIWFICRNIIDSNGRGWVNLNECLNIAKLEKKYFLTNAKQSGFFKCITRRRIYCVSQNKIMHQHGLNPLTGTIRGQAKTKQFTKMLGNYKRFKAFITQCYIQNDLDPKLCKKGIKYTVGRISLRMVAKKFKISPRTAWDNIKLSGNKSILNIRRYTNIQIPKGMKWREWLLQNMELVPDSELKEKIEDAPSRSYFPDYKTFPGKVVLARALPNRYRFTGVYQVRLRQRKQGAPNKTTS